MSNPTYAIHVPTLWPKMEVAIRVALQIWPCRLILACTVYLYNPIDPRPIRGKRTSSLRDRAGPQQMCCCKRIKSKCGLRPIGRYDPSTLAGQRGTQVPPLQSRPVASLSSPGRTPLICWSPLRSPCESVLQKWPSIGGPLHVYLAFSRTEACRQGLGVMGRARPETSFLASPSATSSEHPNMCTDL